MSAGELGLPISQQSARERALALRVVENNAPEAEPEPKLEAKAVNFYYGAVQALHDVNLEIRARRVTALIGPSGCGKSTFLRCINRVYEIVKKTKLKGDILLDGQEIHKLDVTVLRQRVGMVFQKPTPFRKSIFDNVAFGLRAVGTTRRSILKERVEQSLKRAALWDEVRDRLHDSAMSLSGGQQQRLCIARALASDPEVLLLDEPCSALDPLSTGKIEDLLFELSSTCTVIMVTHNMEQAARVADFTGFFLLGRLIEFDRTEQIFTKPADKRTEDYITGRFG